MGFSNQQNVGVREQEKLKIALNLLTWVTRYAMRSLVKMKTCFKVETITSLAWTS